MKVEIARDAIGRGIEVLEERKSRDKAAHQAGGGHAPGDRSGHSGWTAAMDRHLSAMQQVFTNVKDFNPAREIDSLVIREEWRAPLYDAVRAALEQAVLLVNIAADAQVRLVLPAAGSAQAQNVALGQAEQIKINAANVEKFAPALAPLAQLQQYLAESLVPRD